MRRIGSTPAERGSVGTNNCPDVLELEPGGDFLVIGKTVPADSVLISEGRLRPMGASIGADETAIVLPRQCLLDAAKQLAAEWTFV